MSTASSQRSKWHYRLLYGVAVIAIAAIVMSLYDQRIRVRAALVIAKAAGNIEDITWRELYSMLEPGSGANLEVLLNTKSAYAVTLNPHTTSQDVAAGAELFERFCASCHGPEGMGESAPSLVGRSLVIGDSDWALHKAITQGLPERGMPRPSTSITEAWQIVSYLRDLQLGAHAGLERTAQTLRSPSPKNVSPERLRSADSEPENWLTYSGTYRSWRYTSLEDVTNDNVADLRLVWALQLDASPIEASPLVVDGTMYLTVSPSDVVAVEAETGEVHWTYRRDLPRNVQLCCGAVNRGVALLDHRVFLGTLDGFAVALDAVTGDVLWETEVADYRDGFSITAAPLAIDDMVIFGVAGGEFGIRGFLDAYDASTGAHLWRFYTIPEPGEYGSETWAGESWRMGGGPTWLTGSYDAELGLLYWGVGNPAPDFNGNSRPGDNLFTNSVIALDAETGKLEWHFQFTPHDEHDWDSNQIPVLVDQEVDGEARRLMLWANRNGFYYVLDRTTGEFLRAVPFVTQNWADGIDSTGRPILRPEASPSESGTLTWPGMAGGANWWAPSYSPRANLFYVPFADSPRVFIKNVDFDEENHQQGVPFLGGASTRSSVPRRAGIRALHPLTGELVWEHISSKADRPIAQIGGTLATAGNLVFFGDVSDFVAVDAHTGAEIWRVGLGGSIRADPTSFAIDGQQRIAISAGAVLFVFGL